MLRSQEREGNRCKGHCVLHYVMRKRRGVSLPSIDDTECPIQQWFLVADLQELLATVIEPETKGQKSIRA